MVVYYEKLRCIVFGPKQLDEGGATHRDHANFRIFGK